MALQKQMVPLTFGGGLDTKTDQASVPLGKWLVLENARFVNPKSIRKRNGAAPLATSVLGGGSIAAGSALASRNNELVLGDGTSLYSYDQPNTSWVNQGALPGATLSLIGSVGSQYSVGSYDSALHANGLQCIVTGQNELFGGAVPDLVCFVIDTLTGHKVAGPITVDTAGNSPAFPRVCVLGSFFFIAWSRQNAAPPTIDVVFAQAISVTAPQTLVYGSAQQVTSVTAGSALALGATELWDLTVSNNEIYVSFCNAAGTTTVFGITGVSPYSQPHSVTVAGTAPVTTCVCGNLFNNDVVVGIIEADTTAKAFAYSSTLSSQTMAPATIDTQAAGFASISAVSTSASGTGIQFVIGWGQGATDACFLRKNTLGASYVVGTAATIVRGLKLAGKPFVDSGTVYVPAWFTGSGASPTLQSTWMLVNLSGRAIAKAFANGLGGGYSAMPARGGKYVLPGSPSAASRKYNLPISNVIRFNTNTAGVFASGQCQLSVVQLNFSDTINQYTKGQLGDCLLVSSAVPQFYDGSSVTEHGFLAFPEIQSLTNIAGGVLSAGTYQYLVIYEWQDASGQIHRSAPSVAKSVTVNVNDKVTVVVSTLRVTSKTGVWVQVYRTIANGTTFFQLSNSITGASNMSLYNDPTVDTVSFVDVGENDTNVIARPQPYTTGGVLQSAAAPPLNSLIVHRNRVIGIDPTTGQLAYTKQFIPGSTGQPIEFSGFLTMNIDTRGGNPTALASLDEKLIIFKSDRIFMVLGQGPDATGQNNDFTDAVQVSTDTGCAAPKSIVVVPDGLMFKSPKGIYLLDRALRVSYIGADVEAHNSANVTSACLIPSTNEVRFSLDSGKVLVYDYRAEQWGVFTNISAVDATIWGGQYTYLTATGIASQETPGAFVDPGSTFIKMKAVSAWVQLAQIQGFQRIWRVLVLGQYKSAHQLTVKLAHDFATSFDQQNDITVASDPAPYQYRVHCRTQKSEALQISVEDVSTGTNGESMSLSGFMLEVGIKKGAFKPSAAKSVG